MLRQLHVFPKSGRGKRSSLKAQNALLLLALGCTGAMWQMTLSSTSTGGQQLKHLSFRRASYSGTNVTELSL